MAASGAGHSDFAVSKYILILLFFCKNINNTANNNCEHCLEVLKKKIKSYVVCVVL